MAPPKGEANKAAKVTAEDVRAIRRDTRPCKVVGDQYGLSPAQVSRIRNGTRWGHLLDEPAGKTD